MPYIPTTPDEQALYDLATQLLGDNFQNIPPDSKIELLPGAIPELPVPLPLPRNANLVGSMVVEQKSIVVLLHTPHLFSPIEQEYFPHLNEAGWRRTQTHHNKEGFRAYIPDSYSFCHPLFHRGLSIQPRVLAKDNLQIKLTLSEPDYRSSCYEADPTPIFSFLPTLRTPPFVGILHRSITTQSHNDKIFHTSIMLKGVTSLESLQVHYYQEMLQQEWRLVSDMTGNLTIQSVWVPENDKYADWQGIFTISRTSDFEFFLLFHAHYRITH